MKLEIESVEIVDVQEISDGSSSCVKEGVLYVNLKELSQIIMEDDRFQSVDINLVRPQDQTRILNIMDVVQPRCKIDRVEADFPGFIGLMQTAGEGRTRSLEGVAVLVSNAESTRHYSALLDSSGYAAELSRYGKMRHVHIAPYISKGTEERNFEDAVKIAGFKTAVYLARAAEGHPVSRVQVYDLDIPALKNNVSLPRIACYYQLYSPQHDHHGISDNCFYGTDVRNQMPTILHPNEILDGGVVGHHTIRSLDTYSLQNHAVIKELYRHHGKELSFVGVVCGVANLDPVDRKRKAVRAANLVKNVLGADGVIIVKIHGGMPHVDASLVGEECERLGIKTALFIQPLTEIGTLSETLLFNNEALDLIVATGYPFERVKLSLNAKRFLGGTAKTKVYRSDPIDQYAGDQLVDVEESLIVGVHDQTGGAKIIVKEY